MQGVWEALSVNQQDQSQSVWGSPTMNVPTKFEVEQLKRNYSPMTYFVP